MFTFLKYADQPGAPKQHAVMGELAEVVERDLQERKGMSPVASDGGAVCHWDPGGPVFKNWPELVFEVDYIKFTCWVGHYEQFRYRLRERCQERVIHGTTVVKIHGEYVVIVVTPAVFKALAAAVEAKADEAEKIYADWEAMMEARRAQRVTAKT